ncbi:MAG: PKD domain-containing protein, partial [Mycobacterium leprae]
PWRVDSSPASQQAFIELAADARAHARRTASLFVDTEHGPAPLRVTFDGSTSAAAGRRSGHGIASWRLDFGDGSPPAFGRERPPRRLPHTYRAGTYTAQLTVRDREGGAATDSRTISVVGPPSVAADAAPATRTSAVVHAWVKPHGLPATVRVEWGTANRWRSRRLAVPALGWAKHVRLRLTGLAPGKRYEWRVVATTRAGTTVLGGRHVRTWGPRR